MLFISPLVIRLGWWAPRVISFASRSTHSIVLYLLCRHVFAVQILLETQSERGASKYHHVQKTKGLYSTCSCTSVRLALYLSALARRESSICPKLLSYTQNISRLKIVQRVLEPFCERESERFCIPQICELFTRRWLVLYMFYMYISMNDVGHRRV